MPISLLLSVKWKAEKVPKELGDLDQESSSQSVVDAAWDVLELIIKCKKKKIS